MPSALQHHAKTCTQCRLYLQNRAAICPTGRRFQRIDRTRAQADVIVAGILGPTESAIRDTAALFQDEQEDES